MARRSRWGCVGAIVLVAAGSAVVLPGAVAGAGTVATFTNLSLPTSNGGWVDETTTGDLNGDGLNDAVVATGYGGGNVEVFYQKPDHTLSAPVVLDGAGSMLRVADVNGDGRQDLVNVTATGLNVRLQLANGTLGVVSAVPIPNFTGRAEVGDYDGDGRTDVVAIRSDNTVAVLRQQADGTLAAPAQIGSYSFLPSQVQLGDLNGDHRTDVAAFDGTTGLSFRNQLANGQLDVATTLTVPSAARDFVLGDFDSDGRLDVATSHNFNGADYVFYRQPDLTWGPGVGLTEPGDAVYYSSLRTADVDNDGKLDLVAIKSHSDTFVYLQGASGLSLQPVAPGHSVSQWPSAQDGWVGDINGDGWPDTISGAYYGALSISLNTTGSLAPGIGGFVTGAGSGALAGITVSAFGAGGALAASTTSDGAGHYFFPANTLSAATPYRLQFSDPTHARATAWYSLNGPRPAAALANPVSFSAASSNYANIALPIAATASGRVVDGHRAGAGQLSIDVLAVGAPTPVASTATAADGSFSVPGLLPGSYTVSIVDPSNAFEPEWWGLPGRAKTGPGAPVVITTPTTALGTHTIGAAACASVTFAAGVNLDHATLTGCWRKAAVLTGASVQHADLAGTQLIEADLSSVNLTGSDLSHANLFLAHATGSTRTAVTYADTTCPDGTNSDAHGATCDGHLANPVGSNAPVGAVLGANPGVSTHVTGWALDPDTIDPITVRVVTDGGTPLDVIADLPSAESSASLPLYGANHGFDVVLGALSPGVHQICVAAKGVGGGGDALLGCPIVDNPVTNTSYTPVAPSRILDTRNGTGTGGSSVPIGPNSSIDLTVTNVGGTPASHVSAVVLNVTATQPTAPSFLTVWPALTSRPVSSNLNFGAGQTVPNLVVAKVGANGKISIYNLAGSVHVVADVAGYFDDGTVGGGQFHPMTPVRVLDTRTGYGAGGGKIGPGGVAHLQIGGNFGIGLGQARAVVLNVTVTEPTAPSFLTVYPSNGTVPTASNLNFGPNQTVPNLVIVKVSPDGWVDFANQLGSTHVIADLAGWFDDGTLGGSQYNPLPPARILDTRTGNGSAVQPVYGGTTIHVHVATRGGVPFGARAVVLNVTATNATAGSFLTLLPTGSGVPVASNLNFAPGQTVPNLVVVPVSSDGWIDVYNEVGAVDVVVDVAGWFT